MIRVASSSTVPPASGSPRSFELGRAAISIPQAVAGCKNAVRARTVAKASQFPSMFRRDGGWDMQIDKTDLGQSVTRLKMAGRLDIGGAAAAEIPIGLAAKACDALIVDMSEVSFVASLGVRHLMMAAKTIDRRGGKMVLFAASEPVADVLGTMGLTELIPIVSSEAEALDLVGLAGR